jgi:adenosylmethionine-8-amino-7-oxononanoate aminotransferase
MTPQYVTEPGSDALSNSARDHLWMHFTRHSTYYDGGHVPVIVKGEGSYIWDDQGKKYFDGLSGLFVVQAGHGRKELAAAGARQAEELAFFPIWSYAHPRAIELAERLAGYAPGDLNRVFFTTGGGEAVEEPTCGPHRADGVGARGAEADLEQVENAHVHAGQPSMRLARSPSAC